MRIKIFLLLALSMFLSSEVFAKDYVFGIVPQQSSKKLAKLWTPVLQKLSEDTGYKIRFATAKDIPTFEKRMAEGQYDFAYMNPYHFTVFNESPGYIALAHQSDKRIKGILVVRKDSTMTELSDLDSATLAFPSPAAFAATILPSAYLKQSGVDVNAKYVSSHDSVYMAVARGLLPAGGGIIRTFENTDSSVRDSLRILWKSDGYTPHAFAAHPRVLIEDRKKLALALSSMSETEEGLQLLSTLNFKSIQLADDSHWDDVRSLKITELDEID